MTAARSSSLRCEAQREPMPDDINDRIAAALIRGALLDTRRITVTAAGSRVILTGAVQSWSHRRAAARTAWSAPGVTQVENHITVDPERTA
jgi:osmotically-inducible protein OsmY